MEETEKHGPYNQYIPYKNVVYHLTGYHVFLEDEATLKSTAGDQVTKYSTKIRVICQRDGG